MPKQTLHIAVVGCGMAGLASAIALSKKGYRISLFEKFSHPKPLGAGILLQPSGLLALQQLGVLEKLEKTGDRIDALIGDDVKCGRIMDVDYRQLSTQEYGYNYALGMHRGNLFTQLMAEAKHQGCEIHCNQNIVSIKQKDERYSLRNQDDEHLYDVDAVIIANGTESTLRKQMLVKQSFTPYSWGALWAILPDEQHHFSLQLKQRYDNAQVMVGMLPTGIDPTSKKHCASFFWSMPVNGYDHWKQQPLNSWKRRVATFWPELEQTLEPITSHDQLAFARYGRVSMQAYHDRGIVCIGDAAHGMSPQLGQGTNLALIDAIHLARCIENADSIEGAFKNYTMQRRAHIRFYHYASWLLTPLFQSHNRATPWARNKVFKILNALPYSQRQALKTVAGFKTGLFFDKTIL